MELKEIVCGVRYHWSWRLIINGENIYSFTSYCFSAGHTSQSPCGHFKWFMHWLNTHTRAPARPYSIFAHIWTVNPVYLWRVLFVFFLLLLRMPRFFFSLHSIIFIFNYHLCVLGAGGCVWVYFLHARPEFGAFSVGNSVRLMVMRTYSICLSSSSSSTPNDTKAQQLWN